MDVQLKTVFITGASSGIGRSLAHEFAQAHYNLVLVARDEIRLADLKQECEKRYGVQVWVIACDLSQLDPSLAAIKLWMQTTSIFIDVLVNNAGFGMHGDFCETNLSKEIDMVNLQTNSVLSLTKLFLPSMVAKKQGAILNVGSVYSFTPVPYQAVYGACKSFLLHFSLSLAHEVKKSNIKVTALCPGTTQTEFRLRSKVGKIVKSNSQIMKGMTSDEVAKCAFKALQKGKLICVPGATNKIFVFFTAFLPSAFLSRVVSYVNGKRGVNTLSSH